MNFCFEFLQELSIVWEAIPNTWKSVSSFFQTPRSWLKKTRLRLVFPTYFSVFGNRRKHSLPRVWSITWNTPPLCSGSVLVERISARVVTACVLVFNNTAWVGEGVFHVISKHWEVDWKNEAQPSFFKWLRGVWISDETHFRVFYMASQMIDNSWRNSRLKLAKFYGN